MKLPTTAFASIYSCLLTASPPPYRCSPPRAGLMDWMLEDAQAFKSPLERICRPEGWDCILRVDASTANLALTATVNLGLRFKLDEGADRPSGSVTLINPSKAIEGDTGSWRTISTASDGVTPTSIEWRLTTSAESGLAAGGGKTIVAPASELIGTFSVDPDGGALLCDGKLYTGPIVGGDGVGTCDASPMPLMGSN